MQYSHLLFTSKSSTTSLRCNDLPIPEGTAFQAAAYTDAPKKILDRKCTMDDVADFVTDYINSDVSAFIMAVYH
jgi:hypothetical protein